jgi:hypothetical protein
VNKTEVLKLIADYGRAVSNTCYVYSGRSRKRPDVAIKEENKHFRKLLRALGVVESVTEEEINNA